MNSMISFFSRGWFLGDAYIYDNGVISLAVGRSTDKGDIYVTLHYCGNYHGKFPLFLVMVERYGKLLTVSDYENEFGIRCHRERHAPDDCIRMEYTDVERLINQLS